MSTPVIKGVFKKPGRTDKCPGYCFRDRRMAPFDLGSNIPVCGVYRILRQMVPPVCRHGRNRRHDRCRLSFVSLSFVLSSSSYSNRCDHRVYFHLSRLAFSLSTVYSNAEFFPFSYRFIYAMLLTLVHKNVMLR